MKRRPVTERDLAGKTIVVTAGGTQEPIDPVRHIGNRSLLLGDRLIGFWEYDPDAEEVVAGTFEPLPRERQKALRDDCERLAGFESPKAVIAVDELPTTVGGKVLKHQLRAEYATFYEDDADA